MESQKFGLKQMKLYIVISVVTFDLFTVLM